MHFGFLQYPLGKGILSFGQMCSAYVEPDVTRLVGERQERLDGRKRLSLARLGKAC
jgi:hypothetical protein